MSKYWCEHMNPEWLKEGGAWQYCPLCGAKRQEEQKKLRKKIENKNWHNSEELANIALEHFEGVIKEAHESIIPEGCKRGAVLHAMRESI